MTESIEPENTAMEDPGIVESVVRDNFEIAQQQLTGEQVSHFLVQTIQDLPADDTKVIALIGGPASGKSTLVGSVIGELRALGLSADSVSTDDYSLGTRAWRWERERDDPLSLKDFDLLNALIQAIKDIDDDATTVAVPTYDEATGLAIEAGAENFTHKIDKTDVLVVEGDFDGAADPDLLIFLDVPAEARLRARVARDLERRGEVDAEKVAASFRSRHERQYLPHTLPAVQKADIILRVDPSADKWQYDIYKEKNQSPQT